jgi:prevent-host-death family protein
MTAISQTYPLDPLQADWQLQDAKNRFSQVVRAAREGVPQWVTVHGKRAVVVLSAQQYAQLNPEPVAVMPKTSLLDDLRCPGFLTDEEVAQYFERGRSKDSMREVDFSDL